MVHVVRSNEGLNFGRGYKKRKKKREEKEECPQWKLWRDDIGNLFDDLGDENKKRSMRTPGFLSG